MAESRIDELRKRVAQEPGSRLFAALAEEYRRAGELAEAVRVARQGLRMHPGYPAARLTLGRALLESGEVEAARSELTEALRQAPDSTLANRLLAQALEAAGDLDGALRQYRATLPLAPGDQELVGRLAAVERKLAEQAARRGHSAAAAAGAGGRRSGEEEGAGDVPFCSPTLAELYVRQGFVDRAIEVYRRVLLESPANDRARARLAELLAAAREGDGEGAEGRRRQLQRAIDCLELLLGATRRR